MKTWRKYLIGMLATVALLAAGCGDDDTSTPAVGDSGGETGSDTAQNACPADGCTISIASVATAGEELEVTFDVNFDPDIANNHVHIYWDTFEPGQVSNDATDRGLEQGTWVPTDSSPVFVTDGAVSTSVREGSSTLCVVAGDRDHNVIDEGAESCTDVSEFL